MNKVMEKLKNAVSYKWHDMEMEYVTVDQSGRLVLPKKVRREFDTNVFQLELERNSIRLKPKKGLLGLFGRVPGIGAKGFLRKKKEEVKREDSS